MIRRPPRSPLFPYTPLFRSLLRQSARKNTAVACHWIRGRDHSELLWIVGDGRQFNAEGAVPTNTTDRKSTRLNSSHLVISYAVFCLKKKKTITNSHKY